MDTVAGFVVDQEYLVKFRRHIRCPVYMDDGVTEREESITFDSGEELRVTVAGGDNGRVDLMMMDGDVILGVPADAIEQVVESPADDRIVVIPGFEPAETVVESFESPPPEKERILVPIFDNEPSEGPNLTFGEPDVFYHEEATTAEG
jgi:hypothetical protein